MVMTPPQTSVHSVYDCDVNPSEEVYPLEPIPEVLEVVEEGEASHHHRDSEDSLPQLVVEEEESLPEMPQKVEAKRVVLQPGPPPVSLLLVAFPHMQ